MKTMPRRYSQSILLLVLLSLVCQAVKGQAYSNQDGLRPDSIYWSQAYSFREENPLYWTLDRRDSSALLLQTGYAGRFGENGSVPPPQSSRRDRYHIHAMGVQLGAKQVLTGMARYAHSYEERGEWNRLLAPSLFYPYWTSDTLSHSQHQESYSLGGSYAWTNTHYGAGLRGQYEGHIRYARQDPRFKTTGNTTTLEAFGSVRTRGYLLGLTLGYQYHYESLSMREAQPDRKDLIIQHMGLGVFHLDQNTIKSSYASYLTAHRFFATLLLSPTDGEGISLRAKGYGHTAWQEDKAMRTPASLWVYGVEGECLYTLNLGYWGLEPYLQVGYRIGKGTERLYDTIRRNDQPRIMQFVERYSYAAYRDKTRTGEAGGRILYSRPHQQLLGQFGCAYRHFSSARYKAGGDEKIRHLNLKEGVTYLRRISKHWIRLSEAFAHRLPLEDALHLAPYAAPSLHHTLVSPVHRWQSGGQSLFQLSAQYGYHFTGCSLGLALRYHYQETQGFSPIQGIDFKIELSL